MQQPQSRLNNAKNSTKKSSVDERKNPAPSAAKRKGRTGISPELTQRYLIQVWAALCLILTVQVSYYYVWEGGSKNVLLDGSVASFREVIECDAKDYVPAISQCSPSHCLRYMNSSFATRDEVARVRSIADHIMAFGGGNGVTIFDFVSGALSAGNNYIDVYSKLNHIEESPVTSADVDFLAGLLQRIKATVEAEFGAPNIQFTSPLFISRIQGNGTAQKLNDEYWHRHVDTEAYRGFVYTTLLYLSDSESDFGAGEFVFTDTDRNVTVQPRRGRLSMFTSGHENAHVVTRVSHGTRYAFTVPFTCSAKLAVPDPVAKLRAIAAT